MNANKLLLILTIFIVSGCSDSVDKATDDHVFKTQTDALDKAKKIEDMIINAADQQKNKIEEQGH